MNINLIREWLRGREPRQVLDALESIYDLLWMAKAEPAARHVQYTSVLISDMVGFGLEHVLEREAKVPEAQEEFDVRIQLVAAREAIQRGVDVAEETEKNAVAKGRREVLLEMKRVFDRRWRSEPNAERGNGLYAARAWASEELAKLAGAATPVRDDAKKETRPEGIGGRCCTCGYDGEDETPCPLRVDATHCEHWWDGPEEEDPESRHVRDDGKQKEGGAKC